MQRTQQVSLRWAVLLLAAVTACEPTRATHADRPVLLTVDPGSSTSNVLSARAVFSTPGPAAVRVIVRDEQGKTSMTPIRAVAGGEDTLTVLGLRPSTSYTASVELLTGSQRLASSEISFTTNALPPGLANAHMARISGSTTSMSLTAVNVGGQFYAVAFDTAGNVAWYRDFSAYGLPVANVTKQRDGNITAFLGTSSGWQPSTDFCVEVTPEGNVIAEYHAPDGYYMDTHEILITGSGPDRTVHFFTYSIRNMDLTTIGGGHDVATAGHQLVRLNAAGEVEFRWDAWDHIGLDEWVNEDDMKAIRTSTDFDHPNALTFDGNGNYVVSWRNLNQLMSIDAKTGDVLWRFGGLRGQYAFVGDELGGFSKQHAVKVLPDGHVLVFDNGTDHSPAESRAAEYRLNPSTGQATIVWQFRHDPALFARYVGWTERLSNGDTWVAFSFFGRVVQVGPAGDVRWEGQLRVDGVDRSQYRIVPMFTLY